MSNEELETNNEVQAGEQVAENPTAPETTAAEETAAPQTDAATETAETSEPQTENVDATEPAAAPEQAKADKPKAAKRKVNKQASQESGGDRVKKLKLFKLIYYPVLALLVAVMLIFSAIDGAYGGGSKVYGDAYYTAVNDHIAELSGSSRSLMLPTASGTESVGSAYARDYIVNALTEGGFANAAETKTEKDESSDEIQRITTTTDWFKTSGVKQATVTLQTATLEVDVQSSVGLDGYLVGATVTNVIAAIPASGESAGATVVTVRYDSRTDTTGAADNAAFVANALQTLIEYKNAGASFKNDVIVVFTEELDLSYGSYAFFECFKGLDDVVSRAKYGINLDAYGNGGTLAMTDTSNAVVSYISACANLKGAGYTSSAVYDTLPAELKNKNAVSAFGDIPALQIAVVGGLDAAQSGHDNADNISQSVVRQQAQLLKSYMDKFGASSEAYTNEGNANNVFYSYLGDAATVYGDVVAYVIGALILALLVGTVVAMALKKTFSLKNMFIALGVQVLVAVSTFAAMLAAYFLVTLMLTGFGVLPLNAITTLTYLNAGIFIAALFITVAASFGFTTMYKKLFRVTSSDAVRGTAVMFGLLGAVMSFVCPAYSYMTSWLGLTLLAVLLLTVLLHKTVKDKFGIGMDRLFLYVIPVAFCLPLTIAPITMLGGMLPTVLLPALMLLVTGMLGVAMPYLDRTQPMLDRLAKKLPNRTIRVQRTVTERVEDRAKKGKFTEKTVTRVEKEKVPVNYKNYFGISVVALIGIVIALFSGGFGVSFGKALTGYYSYDNAIYNDSLVYEIDMNENTQKIVIGDLMTYKFARYYISDLEWDAARGSYVKSVSYNRDEIIYRDPRIEAGEKDTENKKYAYTVTTFDGALSNVTITIPNASGITRITVKESAKQSGDYEGYVYDFDNQSTIVLRLPYGFDTVFTLDIEGASPSRMEYAEYRYVTGADDALGYIDEWNQIKDKEDLSGVRGGIVIKQTFSL